MSVHEQRTSRTSVEACGHVDPGYEPVLRAFEQNFAERGELGAAFCVVRDGRPVVDLWGGIADAPSRRAWRSDSLVTVFSQTKAWVALCLLRLVDEGRLELDAPVARYWPEFAAGGKEGVLVSDVVSHTSRLPTLVQPADLADIARPLEIEARLARQRPERDPRGRLLYHGLTFGWLCDGLVRRVDGRSVGRFLREEICDPLGLELWIGLPPELERRLATLRYADDWGSNDGADPAALARDDLLRRYWANPVLYPPERVVWNDRELRLAEIPSINGVGAARSIARLYGFLADGGQPLLSREAVELARMPRAVGRDPFSGLPVAFGVGFQLQTSVQSFGPVRAAFGHSGMGGSIHGAWPEHGVGFSYCLNELRDSAPVDARAMALTTALAMALGE